MCALGAAPNMKSAFSSQNGVVIPRQSVGLDLPMMLLASEGDRLGTSARGGGGSCTGSHTPASVHHTTPTHSRHASMLGTTMHSTNIVYHDWHCARSPLLSFVPSNSRRRWCRHAHVRRCCAALVVRPAVLSTRVPRASLRSIQTKSKRVLGAGCLSACAREVPGSTLGACR